MSSRSFQASPRSFQISSGSFHISSRYFHISSRYFHISSRYFHTCPENNLGNSSEANWSEGVVVVLRRCVPGKPSRVSHAFKNALIALSQQRPALDAVSCITWLTLVRRRTCARKGAIMRVLCTKITPLDTNSLKTGIGVT